MIAIYARQSVEKPDSISVETQIAVCRQYTGQEEAVEFVDIGYSGKNTNRPRLQQLLEEVSKGSFSAVFVYRLDRISRSLYDFTLIMQRLEQRHVRFVSCTEWFDTDTPMGRAMLSMAATFSQLERETISQRVSDVYLEKCRKGCYMGGRVPLGYFLDPQIHRYEICAREADIVNTMFQTYLTGEATYVSIAAKLKDNGMLSRNGVCFQPARIGEILRNPVYLKWDDWALTYARAQGIRYIDPGVSRKDHGVLSYGKNKNDQFWVASEHEGIIDSRDWIGAQLIRLKRKGEALRITQERLDSKNFYAFNPAMDQ